MNENSAIPWQGEPTKEELIDYFEMIVTENQEILLRQAFNLTFDWHIAEDIVQESFDALYQALLNKTIEVNIKNWLKGVVSKKISTYFRRKIVEKKLINQTGASKKEHYDFCELEFSEFSLHAISLLKELPERERQVLNLKFFEQLSYEEIAVNLGTSPQTVRNQCHSGLEKLKSKLRKVFPEEVYTY